MISHYSSDEEVERIGRSLLDRSLPKREWTHAAHFAAALWLLRRRPDILPEAQMPEFIRAYNEATGGANTDSEGYHETITLASLRAARRFLASHPATHPLHELVNLLMASPLGDPNWLLAYWSRELLFSVEARRTWVEPDLQPLPA